MDPELGWFREGLAAGELLLHRCESCGAYSEPRTLACPRCGSAALASVPTSGRAEVVSWTRTHGRPREDGSPGQRRTFVIAELEEGPWWWGELLDAGEEPAPGQSLRLDFRSGPDGQPLPVFRPGSS